MVIPIRDKRRYERRLVGHIARRPNSADVWLKNDDELID